MGISVVVHTYNSEKYLEKCLESVKNCEEIIICDMGSKDRTLEIAQKYRAKIIYHKNVGFADPARNYALTFASQKWILALDSDEEAPEELLLHLRILMNDLPKFINAVYIPRKNIHLGKVLWILYPNSILRFFRNGAVSFSEKVHCSPTILSGGAHYIDKKRKDMAIIHHVCDSIDSWVSKMNTYTTLELEKYQERNIKFSAALLFARPTGEFIKRYFLKCGFMHGWHGFIFSVLLAFYKFISITKLWAKEIKQKEQNIEDKKKLVKNQ
ncbi:MAG TPA: glycosyltransferase family 2 protein [Candidatus Gastranaerophilales bacterium]|nr:glycosyltransferase family 2 protein [Candidatus Gastranaerophilales bacterium]